jgi:hypothetical protein
VAAAGQWLRKTQRQRSQELGGNVEKFGCSAALTRKLACTHVSS